MWRPTQMPAAAATSWAAVKQATSQVRDQPFGVADRGAEHGEGVEEDSPRDDLGGAEDRDDTA